MAVFVLKDCSFRVGASSGSLVSLSSYLRSITVTYSVELQDKTAMGSSARKRIFGLKDWTASLEFNQDYAASKVDATFWPIVGSTGGFCIVKPKSSAVGAGNPRYYGAFLLGSYSPFSGSVGNLATVSISIQGDGLLNRSTAST